MGDLCFCCSVNRWLPNSPYNEVNISYRIVGFFILITSCTILLAALSLQFIAGLPPCELCHLQRWPYVFASMFALLMLTMPKTVNGALVSNQILFVILLVFLFSALLASYHYGIEMQWWEGISSCTNDIKSGDSLDELKTKLLSTPVVQCDQPAWQLFQISLAGYNALISLLLLAICASLSIRLKSKIN